MTALEAPLVLMRANQPAGFDCPGCALLTRSIAPPFSSVKTAPRPSPGKRPTSGSRPSSSERHTVTELLRLSATTSSGGFGRLTHPMAYDAASDKFRRCRGKRRSRASAGCEAWTRRTERSSTWGASSERPCFSCTPASTAPTIFPTVRTCATKLPAWDCRRSIGIGKGTVSLDDFEQTELIISMGHNPGTNHPRMMGTLHGGAPGRADHRLQSAARGALERFADPQDVLEMATFRSTPIASTYSRSRRAATRRSRAS